MCICWLSRCRLKDGRELCGGQSQVRLWCQVVAGLWAAQGSVSVHHGRLGGAQRIPLLPKARRQAERMQRSTRGSCRHGLVARVRARLAPNYCRAPRGVREPFRWG